jgi:transposase InsO family protein
LIFLRPLAGSSGMLSLISAILRALLSGLQSRSQLLLENMALRHQLTVLRRSVAKPRFHNSDRWLWMLLERCWSDWRRSLLIVQPRTVIGWHRWGFRLFWRWKSRVRGGRPSLDRELMTLIRRMWSSNPTWGSKRIQAELAKLGITVSDSTIRKYRPRRRRTDQTWKSFLNNHAKDLIAVDFFTVPTATFRVLYVFLVLAHERRKVLHFGVTEAPSAAWAAQQLTEAFPYANPPHYLLRDRDGLYGWEFVRRTEALGLEQKLIAPAAPWQNPYVERWIGSVRRECLDHVIVLNAQHLYRLLTDYADYHHRHRPHRSLAQDCPEPRPTEAPAQGKIIALSLLGGMHHRYTRQAA